MSRSMILGIVAVAAILIAVPVLAQDGEEANAPAADEFGSPEAKSSYAIGLGFVRSLRDQNLDIDDAMVIEGVQDGLAGSPRMTDEELQQTMSELQKTMMEKQLAEQQAAAAGNLAEGEAFLAANREKEGVVALENGLQYEILEAGDGPMPDADDQVTVHYTGTLIDGTKFDSSVDRGTPATLGLDRVIPGWTQGLQLMPVGSKWRLFIPPSLGYGERAGGPIPPNSTLIFEVELLSIVGDEDLPVE